MRSAVSALALLLLQAAPCDHRGAGASIAVDLDAVEKAYRESAKSLAVAVEAVSVGNPLDRPFDCGLPSCRGRVTRRVSIEAVPAEFVGKKIVLGPALAGDYWAATSARRMRDLAGAAPASRELANRLGVRCAPATVTIRSATEVEIVEE